MHKNEKNAGFSYIEVIISLAILSMVVWITINGVASYRQALESAHQRQTLVSLSNSMLEEVINIIQAEGIENLIMRTNSVEFTKVYELDSFVYHIQIESEGQVTEIELSKNANKQSHRIKSIKSNTLNYIEIKSNTIEEKEAIIVYRYFFA